MTLEKRANGFYYTHFSIKGQQVHRKLHTTDFNEAKKLEAKLKADLFKAIELGDLTAFKSIAICKLIKQYQKQSELDNKKSRNTDNSRFKVLNEFFKPLTPIKDIKVDKIEQLKEYLLEEKEVSTTTVNRYLELLSALLSYAVNQGYLKENPCKKVKKYKSKNYTVRYLSESEEKRLFKYLPEYLKPIVEFALATGLRKQNIFDLQWKQIDFIKNTIEVLDNKGNAYIVIPIATSYKAKLQALYEKNHDDYVFKNPETEMPFVDISKAFNTALRMANIQNFRFHDFRHTFATRLVMAGVPIVTVKELLGHKNVLTTLRYAHCTDKSKIDAINKIYKENKKHE